MSIDLNNIFYTKHFSGDRQVLVGIVATIFWGWAILDSNHGEGKDFFSTSDRPYRPWGPSSILFNRYRSSFPEGKWPEREADHSSPSRPEVKNKWSYTSTPSMPRGVNTDRFTLSVFPRGKHKTPSNAVPLYTAPCVR